MEPEVLSHGNLVAAEDKGQTQHRVCFCLVLLRTLEGAGHGSG